MNDVGKEIKRARRKKGLNQVEFARLAQMSQSVISKIEHNRHYIRVDTLDYIADVLGMNLEIRFVEKH